MLGLKLQLSDALKISENRTFVFNTRANLSPRQNWCGAGFLAPSLLPAGRDPQPHQAPSPGTTCTGYQQGGGKGIHCKGNRSWKRDKQGVWDAGWWGGSIRLPSPSRALLCCPGSAGTAPPAHHPCHGHIHPAAWNTFSSSMAIRFHDSLLPHFLLKTIQRDQLDQNLNQHKYEIKGKKSLLFLLDMLQTLCLVTVAISSAKET